MGRTLLAAVAHPDDDTFGVAGSVALHAEEPGFRFVLIHVTSGEAGMISDPALATRETLGAVREDEDRRSWAALGREPDRHDFLRLPDGAVADHPREGLVATLARIMREERPDVVVTFGPEGITAHPDHIAVGEAATAAFHEVHAGSDAGLRRLLHAALPATAIETWNAELVAAGKDPIDPTQVFQPRGVPDETIGVVVDCAPVAARKLAALREHATQADDMGDTSDDDALRILGTETYVVAWPPRESGDAVLGDVFEGLPG